MIIYCQLDEKSIELARIYSPPPKNLTNDQLESSNQNSWVDVSPIFEMVGDFPASPSLVFWGGKSHGSFYNTHDASMGRTLYSPMSLP